MVTVKRWAKRYVERFGISVMPLSATNKRPIRKWVEYQGRVPTLWEIDTWPSVCNMAIITGGLSRLVVVDCESRDDAVWFWYHRGKTTMISRTPRGIHLYFRHPGDPISNAQRVEGKFDIRGDGGYVAAPPSSRRDGVYSWVLGPVDQLQLPVFRPEWRLAAGDTPAFIFRNHVVCAEAYIRKIRAVSGQGGHDATWRVANILRESGVRESEAMLMIQDWNKTNAIPPWSERELLHKIQGAFA